MPFRNPRNVWSKERCKTASSVCILSCAEEISGDESQEIYKAEHGEVYEEYYRGRSGATYRP